MTTPGVSSSGRGQPAFDQTAAEVIGAVRGQRRPALPPEWENPPGYERAELTDEERAEAAKAADEDARTCRYCLGVHKFPTTIGCPRIAEADLKADGTVSRVRFREDRRWQERVALIEDLAEEGVDGGN